MTWKIRVTTQQNEDKTFEAYDCAVLTPEQKLLWDTVMGEQERITKARITMLMELKLDENGKSVSPYLRKPNES